MNTTFSLHSVGLWCDYVSLYDWRFHTHQMMQWIEKTTQSLSQDHTDIGDSLSSAEINKQTFHNFQSRISVSLTTTHYLSSLPSSLPSSHTFSLPFPVSFPSYICMYNILFLSISWLVPFLCSFFFLSNFIPPPPPPPHTHTHTHTLSPSFHSFSLLLPPLYHSPVPFPLSLSSYYQSPESVPGDQ